MANKQENARRLLERLARDDEFRARLETDPVGTLAEYGFEIDKNHPSVKKGVRLPSKQEIDANLDTLSSELDTSDGIVIFKK